MPLALVFSCFFIEKEFSLQDFASLFSQEASEKPTPAVKSEYLRIQALSKKQYIFLFWRN